MLAAPHAVLSTDTDRHLFNLLSFIQESLNIVCERLAAFVTGGVIRDGFLTHGKSVSLVAAAAATTTTATAARLLLIGFVDAKGTAPHVLAIELFNGFLTVTL